jgi:hypothetical protein
LIKFTAKITWAFPIWRLDMSFDYKRRVATQIADHPIGKLLDSLRMESAFYTSSKLMRPWGMAMPPMPNCMMYHLALEGTAEFRIADAVFGLEEGATSCLFPKGEGHVISDGECTTITPLAELPDREHYGAL